MRFDYHPGLSNTKILKTTRQRKIFLLTSFGFVGFIIIISSLIHSINNSQTQKILLYPKIPSSSITIEKPNNIPEKKLDIIPAAPAPTTELADSNNATPSATQHETWKTMTIHQGDTLTSILQSLSISTIQLKDLTNFIKAHRDKTNITIKPGQTIKVSLDHNNNLKVFQLHIAKNKTIFIEQTGPRNYKIFQEEKPIIKKLNFASNKIVGSFFTAAQSAGLNDALIMEMADIFGWDIDFVMDIRPNDRFRILYEEKFVDNEKIGTGHIVVAEFINQGQLYRAIRFTDTQGRTGYYSPEGYSMNKTFLRTPVKFTRIGSKFSTSRHHPILHRIRAHKGVDYVAPSGTPVKAAGDGKIVLIGRKGGYGNVVELQHGNKYSTLYAHLSSFAQKLTKDSIVRQGQVIGYVGRTGLATGDHLHYEFRVDGVHRDPLTVQFPKANPLPNKHKAKFLSHAQQMLSLLDENDITRFAKK